jgi:hypothetical protein
MQRPGKELLAGREALKLLSNRMALIYCHIHKLGSCAHGVKNFQHRIKEVFKLPAFIEADWPQLRHMGCDLSILC